MNYVIHLLENMLSNSVIMHVFMSLGHNGGNKCQKTMTTCKSFDTAVKLKYLGMAPTNHNTELSTICLIHILAFLGDNQQV